LLATIISIITGTKIGICCGRCAQAKRGHGGGYDVTFGE